MNEISKYMAKIGSKGGKKAAAGMTKQQRVDRAAKAALAKIEKKQKDVAGRKRS